jgi:hypothetical protein
VAQLMGCSLATAKRAIAEGERRLHESAGQATASARRRP